MAYSGLAIKFKLNRPLDELEQSLHLKQDVRLAVEPKNQLSTIKLNSTYLEVVDKWFAWKGALSAFVLGFICLFGTAYAWLVYIPFTRERDFSNGDAALLIFVSCLILPFLAMLIWLLCKESFAYTHYPIRFNRNTRMVHVFRPKGEILSAPWDEVFFTVAKLNQKLECEVRGHLLASDGKTVRETFALSHSAYISDLRVSPGQITFDDSVRGHWEFIRRYMEEGPQMIESEIKSLMPVHARRETFNEGMQRVFANTADSHRFLSFLMYIPSVLSGIVRAFAMRTSKIPQWPKDIDAVCVVESGDPYAIDGGSRGIRIAIFPDDAKAAGVLFGV